MQAEAKQNKLRRFFNFYHKLPQVKSIRIKEIEWNGEDKYLRDRCEFVRNVYYSYKFTHERADFCQALNEALKIITHIEMNLIDAWVELEKIKKGDENAN